jgi:hypothetical protein
MNRNKNNKKWKIEKIVENRILIFIIKHNHHPASRLKQKQQQQQQKQIEK